MTLLLVLRPEPGAGATRARAEAAGFSVDVVPLFEIVPVATELPADGWDAVLLTSANAVRALGAQTAALAGRRAYAVGAATAAAARAAGFTDVTAGDGDATAIVARAAAEGARRLLHPTGREHRAVVHPGVTIETRIVYSAELRPAAWPAIADALRRDAIVLLHSPRAAACFAEHCADRARVRLAAISPAAATAAGGGWRALATAAVPTDAALLDAASRLSADAARG
ncbi:uroporphyrinogen-III synthase [Sphingomonas nostoxanthinifaciens]|uniref:uroporphyrinogen-III synthase n=1 Tax=Sphingomonas nostoxanthinifaciens TaxID=2872652 RepID=UPI001CC1FD16|nr:uroporphyrinogen-III synthase [Sphingomonas nostoxanthinifaciens]UAK24399.1 uroporphyrinogen-III synthase [Sphingomonas nostoxanthinifaciens]